MESQFDLIGTTWKCPRCKQEEIITKDGVVHSCPGSWICKRLDQLWDDYLAYEEFRKIERKFLYGK